MCRVRVSNSPHPYPFPIQGRENKYPLSLWERVEFLGERSELRNSGEGATHVDLPPTRVRYAFTLTEVLLAVVIVGVLAALVLPAVVTHFQEKGFNQAYVRETKTLQSAIEGLAVNENKASFFETMMYKDTEPENYSDSAEAFLKKYLRVSKICGDNNGDCFGKTYYQYVENDKKVYNPEFKGSCAVLKNGASICLTPQVGASPIVGLIDLNGRKAPNVLGKDLRTFSIAAETRLGHRSDTEAVLEYKFDPIVTDEGGEDPCAGKTCGCGDLPDCDPCEGKTCGCGSLPPCETPCSSNPNEWDLTCCEKNKGSIKSSTHHCCSYNDIKMSTAACMSQPYTFTLDCRPKVYKYPYGDGFGSGPWVACKLAVAGASADDIPKEIVDGIKGGVSILAWSNDASLDCPIYKGIESTTYKGLTKDYEYFPLSKYGGDWIFAYCNGEFHNFYECYLESKYSGEKKTDNTRARECHVELTVKKK